MASHVSRRAPRAHWVLLLLTMAVLLAELCLNGWVSGDAGEHGPAAASSPPFAAASSPPFAAASSPLPALPAGTGPVLQVDAGGTVRSAGMPAGAVALTFDDGPDPRWTPQILDALRRRHARATFFVVGSRVNQHPELVRRIVAEGHELGVHTFTHTDLSTVPAWRQRLELDLTRNAIAAATGRTVRLLRPPYSSTPSALTDLATVRAATGYFTVLTDRDTEDWRRPGVDAIVAAALPTPASGGGGGGAVVMLRVVCGDAAEDVASETWLQASRDLSRFSGGTTAFRVWLFRIARNRGIDENRRAWRRREEPTDTVHETGEAVRDAALDAGDRSSTEWALRMIRTLPTDQAEAVMLRVVAGLDVAGTAHVLRKRPGAVRIATMRGLRRLAEHPEVQAHRGTDPREGS